MLRIPDPAQRQMYDTYLKTSFRAKRHLFPESREAVSAIDDAREQLDQMNYYHFIREEKERQEKGEVASKHSDEILSSRTETVQDSETKEDAAVNNVKHVIVKTWLEEALPHLHSDDLNYYTSQLVDDGFDSVELLDTELLIEDLDFMKKAHRRALSRKKGLGS